MTAVRDTLEYESDPIGPLPNFGLLFPVVCFATACTTISELSTRNQIIGLFYCRAVKKSFQVTVGEKCLRGSVSVFKNVFQYFLSYENGGIFMKIETLPFLRTGVKLAEIG